MAMAGCRQLDIDEPKGCKKLIVYVEIDRCATDAIQAVTGCSLGKRTLKFLDYGKMAATFINTDSGKAVRVLARDDARDKATLYAPDAATARDAQKQAYAVMPEELLFSIEAASIHVPEQDLPGYRSPRTLCSRCGEGINLRREVYSNGTMLCIPCARQTLTARKPDPKLLLIVGYKKVGKTSLIEKLIPELSNRGYRVATAKHHHSEFPVEVDGSETDTWRHRRAGATTVALLSPKQFSLFAETPEPKALHQILSVFAGHDIVLVEGYHREPTAKIEVVGSENIERLCQGDENLFALVGPNARDESVPSFVPSEIGPLVDLIEAKILGRT
jgi:formylmethanofuran dehydrogenase subunit E